ncbi:MULTISPECIES: 3-hydroxyacyl-CoA dehydrogenase [Micrococcaceae]|uniref:3-hydroxyacyl-CoA dehydrogenase n=2 Tax=Micrococcales TaxID=85006 RepID=UPI0010357EEA|nr:MULTISPECIES: 3-hydroxyacyl-CoA dehydrogenase [Micrococcaceae]TAP27414.1 3-hydroxyacyl-CoA dehydrogenase [Arthrobacter sp. S41]UXN30923.1 3-hydroxyacyl-CoA dehydrogenase [Glutamicibacter sp. M10]
MQLTNTTVLGTGVLGSQILFQTAYHGLPTVGFDINEEALRVAAGRLDALVLEYANFFGDQHKAQAARDSIKLTTDLDEAVKHADLVIEAVPESLAVKEQTYSKLAEAARPETIFVTNSSTLLPSDIAPFTGRPEQFLALHYANNIWKNNTGEVMGTAQTSKEAYEAVVDFAERTGLVAIRVLKEQPGYVLNSMLVPFLESASHLLVNEVADAATIDTTWKLGTGAPYGPFEIYDIVGLNTAYHISSNGDETSKKFAALLKSEYIDHGKLGVATGEGFYKYNK